ncbi:MAG: histidine kinase [Bradyrhizobiaceae bacterium]|nr:MAG: histidine kinase [Bradyrhizobiaceae bacterium]
MNRLLPSSLFGQTLLVLVAGLIVSHLAGSWIYTSDREQAVRAVGGFAAAQRITNLTRLVREAPREWRERIVAALSDETFRVSLSPRPPALAPGDDDLPMAQAIAQFLAAELSLGPGQEARVSASLADRPLFGGGRRMMGHGPMMHRFGEYGGLGGFGGFRDLQVAVPLADGQWLSFTTGLPHSGPSFSRQFLVSMGLMALIILAVSAWAVRRVTAPLASLSAAAERLGSDLNAPPMPEAGTIEMRQASQAFNRMQARLRGLIANRTHLLVAISHDLRTPLTLLRLRAENIDNAAERDRMLNSIAEMDAMIAEALRFARDEATGEAGRPTDLAALVQSVVDDMADAGLPVTMDPAAPVVFGCRPDALKRAVRNLLDNAIKYGKTARASIDVDAKTIAISIDDDGPGIPAQDLARVLEPFYRVEGSRSRETGGIGLGLAITRSIAQSHGGELRLSNRPEGGLRATIALPRYSPLHAN